MKRFSQLGIRVAFLLVLALGFQCVATPAPQQEQPPAAKAEAEESKAQASTESEEQLALLAAIQSSDNNPQLIIQNLESFLAQYPHSSRREVVLRTICSYALVANAPDAVVKYGRMLLEITPDDPKVLNLLVDALDRQNDPASRGLAIEYNEQLMKIAEGERDREAISGGGKETLDDWTKRIATLYARLGKLYRESGDAEKAAGNFEKSYETYPSASAAEQLGDLASIHGNAARALDNYLTAFAFPEENPDLAHRQEVRRKLGSAYLTQHHSEDNLGDLVLARYDSLMGQLSGRFSTRKNPNAGDQDPLKFVVEKLDGTPLPMAGYQGKVLVVDFWATWCGPCREQGPLLDQVADTFKSDPRIAFIALNVDEDRSGVGTFVQQAGWTVPIAYAQGLNEVLDVTELPTLVVFDRQGKIADREEGFLPGTFVEQLTQRLRKVLQGSTESKK
jgi:thiol-disulfide isomerase/thioredoxin